MFSNFAVQVVFYTIQFFVMRNCLYCIFFLLSTAASYAQSEEVVAHYLASAGKHLPVYTGKIPLPYPSHFSDSPYLATHQPAEGTLVYNGIAYPGIRLRLDLYRERLLASPPQEMYEVILSPGQVDYAVLHGYHVFYFQPGSLQGSPPAGYYLLLHDGGCRVLSHPACSMRETSKDGVTTGWFRFSTRYYILKDGVCHAVKSKGSLLKLFPSHRKELSRYINEQRLNFGRNAEASIVAVVKQYERLNSGL
jgi:hypothetical protein